MTRRYFLHTALATAAGLSTTTLWAQSAGWPDKPIKVVLSQPPGSGPDNVARLLGERIAKTLGQPWVIDNKPGVKTSSVHKPLRVLPRMVTPCISPPPRPW